MKRILDTILPLTIISLLISLPLLALIGLGGILGWIRQKNSGRIVCSSYNGKILKEVPMVCLRGDPDVEMFMNRIYYANP